MTVPRPIVANPAFLRAVDERARASCSEHMCEQVPCVPHATEAAESLAAQWRREHEAEKEAKR